jgi:hypothetical protein
MNKKRWNRIVRLRRQRNNLKNELESITIKLKDKIDKINKKLFKLIVK